MKELFEKMIIKQFGPTISSSLVWDEKKGYKYELINNLWTGFNMGVQSSKSLTRKQRREL